MDDRLWEHIKYFRRNENWGDLDLLQYELVARLDAYREFIGKPIVIHCAAEHTGHSPGSSHYRGLAVDFHVMDMNLIDAAVAAMQMRFHGVGVYTKYAWNNPGLHLDLRPLEPLEPAHYWICWRKGNYIPLTANELAGAHCKALRDQCLLLNEVRSTETKEV